jgi:probable F420-dependent oxidoreductase
VKIRVGLGLGTTVPSLTAERFWTVVDALEAQRFDSIWLSERITGEGPDALAGLAAIAGRTRRLKFGMSVLVLPGRNPVLLAKELATIDVLSEGRLVPAFGLGAEFPAEQQAFAIARKERAGRTDEATRLMKLLWTQDGVTFSGRYFNVEGLTIRPRPVQLPHPDVWFGGHSPAALKRVGTIGEGWLPSFIAPSEYKSKADVIREHARAAGREVEEEHYGALVAWLPDPAQGEPFRALIRARRPDVDPADVVVVGSHDDLRARLEAFIEQGASKFVVVPVFQSNDWPADLADLKERVVVPLEN